MSAFSKPPIHENFYCPHCKRLLVLGAKQCPHCLEELDEGYAHTSAYINFQLTQAISHANMISTFDPAIIFFGIASVCLLWLKSEMVAEVPRVWTLLSAAHSLVWLLPLVAIVGWFFRYGKWRIIDEEEFQSKRQSMRLSFRMWLAAYVVQAVLLLAFS